VWTIVLADGKYVLDTFCQNFEQSKLPPVADWSHRISVAQRNLEDTIGIASFGLEEFEDRADYTIQDFCVSFWIHQARHAPIHDVLNYGMFWGNSQLVAQFDTEWLVVDRDCNSVELIPNALGTTGLLFASFIQGISNVMPGFATYTRVPCLFKIAYHAGMDFDNLTASQQDVIRYAVGRRAMLNVLSFISPRGASSESLSIDGASQSVSFAKGGEFAQLAAQLQLEDAEFVANARRLLGLELQMEVV
jgi:hypothetical protein